MRLSPAEQNTMAEQASEGYSSNKEMTDFMLGFPFFLCSLALVFLWRDLVELRSHCVAQSGLMWPDARCQSRYLGRTEYCSWTSGTSHTVTVRGRDRKTPTHVLCKRKVLLRKGTSVFLL